MDNEIFKDAVQSASSFFAVKSTYEIHTYFSSRKNSYIVGCLSHLLSMMTEINKKERVLLFEAALSFFHIELRLFSLSFPINILAEKTKMPQIEVKHIPQFHEFERFEWIYVTYVINSTIVWLIHSFGNYESDLVYRKEHIQNYPYYSTRKPY